MAERRMFAKSIVLSDAFLDMPMSARCLYFTLGMFADDDGFVGGPKAIMRQCGASQDDMLILLQKRYVLSFESGVIVIKHWRINNYLQNDRRKETTYVEELSTLKLDGKGAYTEINKNAGSEQMYTECIQDVYTDKISIVEDNIVKVNIEEDKSSLSETGRGKSEMYQGILDHWNTLPENIAKVYKISAKGERKRLLDARIKDYGIDQIHAAIDEIPKSDFLMGYGNKGWTITFDWFVKPSNFPKVLEGNYRGKINNTTGNTYVDSIKNRFDPIQEFVQKGDY